MIIWILQMWLLSLKLWKKPGTGSIRIIENQISELEDGLGEVVQELEETGREQQWKKISYSWEQIQAI